MTSDDKVRELMRRWEEAVREGRQIPLNELCADCPELIDDVQREISAMTIARNQVMETMDHAGPPTPMNRQSDRIQAASDEYIFEVSCYADLRLLAEGGLGQIFTAADQELKRNVALKFIKPHLDDVDKRAQFALEGEITARLEHPGVVPLYGQGATNDGRPFQVMRLIHGDSMSQVIATYHKSIKEHGTTSESSFRFRQLLGAFVSTCQTIGYAHSRGIVHRDLKPENVMIGKYGETLVVDWGLAIAVERRAQDRDSGEQTLQLSASDTQRSSSVSGVAGSPAYMSPEQASASPAVGPPADIYGLGATLFELLTGSPPRAGDSVQRVLDQAKTGVITAPSRVNKDVPRALEAICVKALQLDPDDRYPSAVEFARDVDRWLADEPVQAYRESWRERAFRWVSRHQMLAQALAALLLLLLVSGAIYSTSTVMMQQRLIAQRVDSLVREANYNEELITGAFDDLKQDVTLLSQRPQVVAGAERFLADADATEDAELQADFEAFLGLNPSYMQVRFIDRKGYEKVRVDRSTPGGEPFVVRDLQFKGERDYFLKTRELAKGEMYLSNIDVNVEKGKHQWDVPVVRAAVPLFAKGGDERLGIVIINMHFNRLTDLVRRDDEDVLAYLTNDQGEFLYFPGARDLAFCFERGVEYPIEAVYPELENFRRSTRITMPAVDTQPLRSLFITSASDDPQVHRTMQAAIESVVEESEFRDIKIRASKYSVKDPGRGMIVLVGGPEQNLKTLQKRIEAECKATMKFIELPDTSTSNQHEVYARKIFFDKNNPDRFVCLVLAISY